MSFTLFNPVPAGAPPVALSEDRLTSGLSTPPLMASPPEPAPGTIEHGSELLKATLADLNQTMTSTWPLPSELRQLLAHRFARLRSLRAPMEVVLQQGTLTAISQTLPWDALLHHQKIVAALRKLLRELPNVAHVEYLQRWMALLGEGNAALRCLAPTERTIDDARRFHDLLQRFDLADSMASCASALMLLQACVQQLRGQVFLQRLSRHYATPAPMTAQGPAPSARRPRPPADARGLPGPSREPTPPPLTRPTPGAALPVPSSMKHPPSQVGLWESWSEACASLNPPLGGPDTD